MPVVRAFTRREERQVLRATLTENIEAFEQRAGLSKGTAADSLGSSWRPPSVPFAELKRGEIQDSMRLGLDKASRIQPRKWLGGRPDPQSPGSRFRIVEREPSRTTAHSRVERIVFRPASASMQKAQLRSSSASAKRPGSARMSVTQRPSSAPRLRQDLDRTQAGGWNKGARPVP